MDPHEIGKRVREARERKGLVQIELADAVGRRLDAISRLELGKTKRIPMETLARIATALDVSLEWLLGATKPETTYEPIDDESLSDEDYAIEGVRRDLGPLEAAEVEFLRSEFQAVQFSVGRLETEMAIARLKSKLREHRGKLPPPERERVEEPKKAKGESIRNAVLGKKPKGR